MLYKDDPASAQKFIDATGAIVAERHGPRRVHRRRVSDRRAAADLLHRRRRDPPGHPDRRGAAGGLRDPVRQDRAVTARRPRSSSTGCARLRVARGPRGRRRSRSGAASWSRCWAPTAPARPRRSRSSRATGAPMPARCGCSGMDPAREGRALRPRLGLMLQEGGVDPRSTPREVLRLHARLFRDPEDPDALLADAGLEPSRRDPLPAPVRRRAAAARARAGPPRPAGAAGARRAHGRHGPGGQAGDPSAHRRPARGRDDDPAHDPRARRRGAAGGPGGRSSTAGGSWRRGRRPSSPGAGAPRGSVPARHARSPHARRGGARRRRWRPGPGSSPTAPAARYELAGLPAPPDPRLVAALAGWCADRGLLLTDLHLGAADARGALPGARRAEGAA